MFFKKSKPKFVKFIFSISSGKSIISNFSVKSDSGINLPLNGKQPPSQQQQQQQPELQQKQQQQQQQQQSAASKKSETRRNILVYSFVGHWSQLANNIFIKS